MSNRSPDPEGSVKRGRFEIRLVFIVVAAVIVLGAIYVAVFGSPNAENRLRDSPDYVPPSLPGAARSGD